MVVVDFDDDVTRRHIWKLISFAIPEPRQGSRTMRRFLFCFIQALAVFPLCLVAQDTQKTSIKTDPQAVQMLELVIQRMGGSPISGIADVKIEGNLRSPAAPDEILGSFVAKARGEDWAIQAVHGGRTTEQRVLGGAGTSFDGSASEALHSLITSGTRLDIFPLFQRWTEFDQHGSYASVVGTAAIDGVACAQIHVHSGTTKPDPRTFNQHGDIDVFIDAGTGLVLAVRYKAMLGMPTPHPVEVEAHFAKYEKMGGILTPTLITRYVFGQPRVEFQVTAAQIK